MPTINDRLYAAQAGECCYCGKIMWMHDALTGARFSKLYGLSVTQARHRQATREHLIRRVDGGTHNVGNLALACGLCNSKRHETPWVVYKSQRLNEKRWSSLILRLTPSTKGERAWPNTT